MFWKNIAWSWDDAASDENDDGGFLLAADLRRTPDPALDADPTHSSTVPDTDRSIRTAPTSSGPKVLARHSLDSDNSCWSIYASSDLSGSQQAVSIIRGKDGFGFTICSDCPVRVQAVDSGGPAHQSGLRQGDSVLQLNGLPVETWKCADLAQAIRSCPSQVVLVVWRGSPELGLACKTLLRPQVYPSETRNKLLSHPTLSKHRGRWGQGGLWSGSVLRSGLGSLRRDRKENQDEMDNQETFSTVKGTRVTSSNGDNFIILSPVNHAGQPPQPVYRDREGTMGRLCQTRPSRAHNQIGTEQSTTLPLSQSRTVALGPAGNHGNYQNCTIIQSHLQQSGYGNYNSLPPKTLIFPVFVKPLDLCSPDRTIRMSEEMILHQDDLLPSKVLVLIYSDLLLITREEEAGRCNVLQSPLYLNTLQLREVPAEPLHIYVLQRSGRSWTCVFSLEAFSIEQKVRVSLCLHDNKQHHLVTMETTVPYQFTDLPPDYGLLSVGRPSSPYCRPPSFISTLTPIPFSIDPPTSFPSTFPFTCPPAPPPLPAYISPPSSSSTLRSPVWKMRGDREEMWMRRRQEEEERQQGEGESSSEASESVGGGGAPGLLLSPPDFNMDDEEDDSEEEEEELEFECRPAALRRSLSEGSLLREPRSPHFFSDSTIHYLRHTSTFDPSPFSGPPSPQTVRKQLTKEGASLHHMLLLLYGSKREKSRTIKTNKKKNKNLAADLQRRLSFLPKRKTFSGLHGNSLEKALRNTRPPEQEVRRWAGSLQALLTNKYGLAVFRHFLRSEFSEENLDFWLAVEKFKRTRPFSKMAAQAEKIYSEFISPSASRQINMDSFVRDSTSYSLTFDLSPSSFQLAQDQIFSLMETDSYSRFLRSRVYAQLTNQNTDTAVELSNQRRSVS